MRGIMLVKISAKLTPNFIQKVKKIEGVTEAYPVFGRFDVVIFIEGKDFPEMRDVVIKITYVKGIRSTETFTEAR